MKKKAWRTSAANLMQIFRASLLDLIPHLEDAQIPWREEEAYDEWDDITATLFESIVLRSLRWGVADSKTEIIFPAYGHIHSDYGGRSLIEVLSGEPPEAPSWMFFRLGTTETPLDTVQCLNVTEDGEVSADASRNILFTNASFRVWIRSGRQLRGPITELAVDLR